MHDTATSHNAKSIGYHVVQYVWQVRLTQSVCLPNISLPISVVQVISTVCSTSNQTQYKC